MKTKESTAKKAAINLLKTSPEIHCLDAQSYAVYSSLVLELLFNGYDKPLAKLVPAWTTA
jgi:hypothetical protein